MSLFTPNHRLRSFTTQVSVSENLVLASSAIRVNLHDYGLKKALANLGNPQALDNLLNQIRQGFILDETSNSDEQRRERDQLEAALWKLENQLIEQRSEQKRIEEGEIQEIELKISHLEKQLRTLELQRAKLEVRPSEGNRFTLRLYWLIFWPATIFLYFFYVSTFYSAFFRDLIAEAVQPNANIDSILNAIFSPSAFTTLNLHFAAPIVFFLFGLVLHIVFDQGGRWRWYRTAGMLLFIFCVDALLAYSLEAKIHTVRKFMRTAELDYHFYTSPIFYLVLALGFFTCLGWSILLHQIKAERAKFDVDGLLEAKWKQALAARSDLQNQIQALRTKILVIEGNLLRTEREMEQLCRQRETIVRSLRDLPKRAVDFYDGWLEYLNRNKGEGEILLNQCEDVFQQFMSRYVNGTPAALGPVLAQA
jgi:peptidoglycan hydrolase CwlO-like protein